jgi:hypothetical protein
MRCGLDGGFIITDLLCLPMSGCLLRALCCQVDLHLLNPAMAQAALRHELQMWRERGRERAQRPPPFFIITGKGDGSLKQATFKLLDGQGLEYWVPRENPGMVVVLPLESK